MNYIALLAKTYFALWSIFTPIEVRAATITQPTLPTILIDIATCESGMRQYTDGGSLVISPTKDIGLFQINSLHKKEALKMGYDITTIEGNTAYAMYLYDTQGTAPWNSSKHCWQKLQNLEASKGADNG